MSEILVNPVNFNEKAPASKTPRPLVWAFNLGIFLLYVLLAGLITYPFIFQFGSHLIDAQGDSFQNLWYMWWYKEALTTGQDPARTRLMYGLLPSVQVLFSSVFNGLCLIPFEAVSYTHLTLPTT